MNALMILFQPVAQPLTRRKFENSLTGCDVYTALVSYYRRRQGAIN